MSTVYIYMSAILCTRKMSSFLLYTVCITHIYKKKRKERQERTGRALYELSHYLYLGTNQDRLISGSHRDGGGARCYTRHYKPRRSIVSCSSCCSRVPGSLSLWHLLASRLTCRPPPDLIPHSLTFQERGPYSD